MRGSASAEPSVALAPEGALPLEAIDPRAPSAEREIHRGRLGDALKRSLDVVLSVASLILLLPVWLGIALAIRLDSPGPVLYRQQRIGRRGEMFGMFKFRTMIDGAHAQRLHLLHMNEAGDGLFKISEDPRVTRFGSFLRATSLDELPQLLNVISGRMSLVGPRPLIPEEDALIEGRYRARHEMRPGMTGPWQVAGASKIPIREMVKLDLDYIQRWSVLSDLGLIVRTLPHVVGRRGM